MWVPDRAAANVAKSSAASASHSSDVARSTQSARSPARYESRTRVVGAMRRAGSWRTLTPGSLPRASARDQASFRHARERQRISTRGPSSGVKDAGACESSGSSNLEREILEQAANLDSSSAVVLRRGICRWPVGRPATALRNADRQRLALGPGTRDADAAARRSGGNVAACGGRGRRRRDESQRA